MFNLFSNSKSDAPIIRSPQTGFQLLNGGIQQVDKSQALPRAAVYDWFSYDDRATYEANLKTQPADWEWRTRRVRYTVNSQHYRCAEWSQIDWNNSVLMLGCSMVFGLGLDDDQTVTASLSRKLGMPVINLGVSGSSAMFQWINTTKLITLGVTPKRVIYIWPHHFRVADILGTTEHKTCGRWNFKTHDLSRAWNDRDIHSLEYVKLCMDSVTQQWRCAVNHYTFCLDTATYLPGIHRFGFSDYLDYSRDNKHPGPRTIDQWSDHMIADINN
jgi:hypothetical protein